LDQHIMTLPSIRISIPLLVATGLFSMQAAIAGPLRDKIAEACLEQQENDGVDPTGTSGAANSALPPGVKLMKDVSYGSDARQRMDVYLPVHVTNATNATANTANAPVIIMVHGGGWRRGDKAMQSVVQNKVARWVPKGFVFISVNYRMLPDADPLKQADDVASALALAQSNARTWGADPSRFVLMGHSAGAHLVALLASNPTIATAKRARLWLGTVVLDSAALDVMEIMQRKHYRLYDQAFGHDSTFWKAASPINNLTAGVMPILAVCSSKRHDKPCDQAHRFEQQAGALGIKVSVLEQALSHKQINQNLGVPGPYTSAVETFLNSLNLQFPTLSNN
jgi:arylformamidase